MDYTKNRMKSLYIHTLLILGLTAIAFWLRFANLDAINLFNDEYYQFEAAVGDIKLHTYQQYNFYTDTGGDYYLRAKTYTWQVAQSMRWFGINETAARLPAVLWGSLLVPILLLTIWRMTKQPWLAYATSTLVVFDDFFIEMSRFVRMYSMVFVLTMLIWWLVYEFFQADNRRTRTLAAVGVVAATGLGASVFLELILALWAGIGVYVCLQAVRYFWHKDQQTQLYSMIFLLGAVVMIVVGVLNALGYDIIPTNAFTLRAKPHWFYIQELFTELHVMITGPVVLAIGISTIRSWKDARLFAIIVGTSLLAYFVFFSRRWEATRYIGFIIPLFYLVMAAGLIQTAKWFVQLLPLTRKSKIVLGVVIFALFGPWFSWPGVQPDFLFIQQAYADRSYESIHRANVRDAYAFVANQIQPGEVVLIQGPRYFYWPDNSVPVHELGSYKSLEFAEFKELAALGETGGWFVYNETKQRHLRDTILEYADKHFTYYSELDDTLVRVYHFTPEDLSYAKPKK